MNRIKEIFSEIGSATIALVRLFFLVCAMFTSGVHIVLFTRTEVCNIEMRGMPWRCDRERLADNMSFVDKICLENPELLDFADEQYRKDGKLPPIDDDDEGNMDI